MNRLIVVVQATTPEPCCHLGAASIETPTAQLETEPSHLPNLYQFLLWEKRLITGQSLGY